MGWQKVEGEVAEGFQNWDQEPELICKITERQENQGPRGNSKLYIAEKDDGSQIKFWGSKVLDDKLDGAANGIKVKIVYLGKTPSKSGTPYRAYDVYEWTDDIEIPPILTHEQAIANTEKTE